MNAPATLLIVDDEPINLAVLAEVLESDYHIRVAKSGQYALQAVMTEPRPDLILLDIEMPDMSGYQVLETLRANRSTCDIPVIFVTARTSTLDEERGLKLGAADYITKPIRPSIVHARIRTQLENKAARDILKERNDWLRQDLLRAQQVGRIGSWKLHLPTQRLEWSPETYRLFGIQTGTPLRGDSFLDVVYPEDINRVEAAWQAALAGQRYDIEFRTAHSQGQTWVRSIAEFKDWADGMPTLALGTVQDITEKKRYEQQLEALAFRDPLTGLANGHAFTQSLERKLEQRAASSHDICLYQIDIDGLGHINASMGNQAGDTVLRVIGQRLAAFAGKSGEVAHLGGDQFVVAIYAVTGDNSTTAQVHALQDLIEQPVKLDHDTIPVTACIGSVHNTGNAVHHAGPLLRMVDQAMYQAKLGGKGRHVQFNLSQYQSDRSLQDRLDEIRQALRNTEFRLNYQPKVDLLNGQLIGLEALIRWQHPKHGLLAPGEFIPQIEGHPLMVELGDWVIATALAQLLEWQRAGLTTSVSVNIASNQLEHPMFVEQLTTQLAAYPSLQPSQLEVEILESGPMFLLDRAIQTFNRLKTLGVVIALDDFGVGHSSLQTLNTLRPDILKIDRSFVLGMLSDGKHKAIVQAILDLGRTFGLKVIAEGVETQAHGEALIDLGCRYAQGYGIARPMPADQVMSWLST